MNSSNANENITIKISEIEYFGWKLQTKYYSLSAIIIVKRYLFMCSRTCHALFRDIHLIHFLIRKIYISLKIYLIITNRIR